MKRVNRTIGLSLGLAVCAGMGLVRTVNAQQESPIREPVFPAFPEAKVKVAEPSRAVPVRRAEDEKSIKQLTDMFVSAFNGGDAKGVASLYTNDAELIDEHGERIDGRAAIQDFYSSLFAGGKGSTIEVSVSSLRFLGPDAAKETGRTKVMHKDGEPTTQRDYTVVYVKQDGRWLHSSVREEFPAALAHHERLKELEWLVGEWFDESSESIIHQACRWSDDKNFLLRDFEIHVNGRSVMKVNQRIGWDPLTQQIKSWFFDSDGSYGDAYWTRKGNQWLIKSTGVLADGRVATATNTLTRTGTNSARWQSTDRTVGADVAPNHPDAILVRRPPQPRTEPRPK